MIEEWDTGYYARNQLCIPCFGTYRDAFRKVRCGFCGLEIMPENSRKIKDKTACRNCYSDQKRDIEKNTCLGCKKYINSWEKKYSLLNEGVLCEKCHSGFPPSVQMPIKTPQGGNFARIMQAFLAVVVPE
ncbi:hypothetical protein AUJ17_03545 [Candidatus Micrarchaeota archaeon CG1_02_47_40]|nr:MAG: hypothetical protein AUJ17_03545 [Candidatus Micrarchaeota archaeon CG1_02_47_40]